MPTESEWTKFSSKEIAFMDQQIDEAMEIYHAEEDLKEHESNLKLAGSYHANKTVWKVWSDNDTEEYSRYLANDLKIASAWRSTDREIVDTVREGKGFQWIWSLAKYVMERKALTKTQKMFCLDVSKRFSTGGAKAFRSNYYDKFAELFKNWLKKWNDEIKILFLISSLRDKEVGNNETFKIGNLTIHNTVGASKNVLAKIKKQMDKAFRYINGGDISEMKQVLYGHAHLVSGVEGHNVLGFYNSHEDNVYVRIYQRGHAENYIEKEGGYIQVLIHELGHRCYQKKMSQSFKKEWLAYYNEIYSMPFKRTPDIGEKLWFTMKNGNELFYLDHQGTHLACTDKEGKRWTFTWKKGFLRAYLNHQNSLSFPTRYSMTNSEEFFCDTISLYLMGLLDHKFHEKTKRLLGIANDSPQPAIQQQSQSEEKQQESEGIDLKDQIVNYIVEFLSKSDPIVAGDRHLKRRNLKEIASSVIRSNFIEKVMKGYAEKGQSPTMVATLLQKIIMKSISLGVEQGKYEISGEMLFIDVTDLYTDNDNNDSDVEMIVKEKFGLMLETFFDIAKDKTPVRRTLLQLVTALEDVLSKEDLTVDVSVISDIIKESLESLISLGELSTYGAKVSFSRNKYVFSNISVPNAPTNNAPTSETDEGELDDDENPSTAPKRKIKFKPMNNLQTEVMKEVCALLKGGSGDLTASDVFKSLGDKVKDVSLRGFGRSMGKLVRLDYLETNGKCPKGTIYKLSEVGVAWCKINGVSVPPKNPTPSEPVVKEKSVENNLVKEMRLLYQLVQPLGNQKNTNLITEIGRKIKEDKADKLSSSQVKVLSKLVKELNLDLSSLPLIKANLLAGESTDDEEVTPLVMELRKLYVEVRKAGVSKRSLTILKDISLRVKKDNLNEIVGKDLLALQRLVGRAELNTADYPLIFKVVEQTPDEEKAEETEDFPAVTEVGKIILRVIGSNLKKEQSASSIRDRVNKFPDTNVTTKGLGRTMGALVRYGYLEKTGTSPSGTTYKATSLLARWYSKNTETGEITLLGENILRMFGEEPRLLWNSKKMHTKLTTNGLKDISAIGVGRSMGKLARDGWLTKFEDKKVFKISEKGLNWYYNDLAK